MLPGEFHHLACGRDLDRGRSLTWTHHRGRRAVAYQGNLGESRGKLLPLHHLNPVCGLLFDYNPGWIFGQKYFLQAATMVLVVAVPGQVGHPGRLRSYSCSTWFGSAV